MTKGKGVLFRQRLLFVYSVFELRILCIFCICARAKKMVY